MNISPRSDPEIQISNVLAAVSQPARIQILMVIAEQEACVCHFEAVLGLRQASISQHLMVLRKVGLVGSRRMGRNMFYRLLHPEILAVIEQTAGLIGVDPLELETLKTRPMANCPCPQCSPGLDPALTCRNQTKSNLLNPR
ncbi:ArsR/SmtB family transcription factor [Levilinea saccharolytica]|uniref:HTH arsR-type domain-containing protein n=1 Tax=Levilinea saccharolytica TaxID=229921 RepID=A0A0P6XCS8_9CHLR|nr:metalloregulator ArsR/SmtB family transcription factor [Levilinea saccharolytica]KPL80685.1 hypothetical protein ADN01_11150 [Levilinea saccharolytica]GAP17255.1 transcriptional regulator, ArsR family [Levilinea saccharolytica]